MIELQHVYKSYKGMPVLVNVSLTIETGSFFVLIGGQPQRVGVTITRNKTASRLVMGIAAVASVGTMTIAAFAGAEGLGWFINLGLNSSNTPLVLLGDIPASLLALAVDFLLGRLEYAVTSEGLLPAKQIANISKVKRRKELAVVSAP